ncbi:MAG: hypothetical protein CMQ05_14640 [Gammaproteobacteria bacterium]|nr:hypothetical protein [Gammaproteobacteria bacterium]
MLPIRALKHLFQMALVVLVFQVQTAWADDHAREPGIGTKLSVDDIAGKDHTAKSRSLSSLAGENALLIFLNRSADW